MAKFYVWILSLFVIGGEQKQAFSVKGGSISRPLQKSMGYTTNSLAQIPIRLRLRGGCAGTTGPSKDKGHSRDVFIDAVLGSDDQVGTIFSIPEKSPSIRQ